MKNFRIATLQNFLLYFILAVVWNACISPSASKSEPEDANEWYDKKVWLKELQITPHHSINKQEFARQYHHNQSLWNKAFEFLKTKDLVNIAPGIYIIDSGNVFATVIESEPKEKNEINWEAHRKFNDIQYIISGTAEMGIASISDTELRIINPYNEKDDIETYHVSGGEKYYIADPKSFFIFSPEELHRPAIKMPGNNNVKKVVIKVRMPEN